MDPQFYTWIIIMVVISALAVFFCKVFFVTSIGTAVAGIWLTIISFQQYGPIYPSEFWPLEFQRFVLLYAIFAFNLTEVYKFRNGEDSFTIVYFRPNILGNILISAALSAFVLFVCDYLIPEMGAHPSFAIVGWVSIVFTIPAVLYIYLDINKIFGRR